MLKLVIAAAGQPALAPQLDQDVFAVRLVLEQLEPAVDVLAVGRAGEEQQIDAFDEQRRRGRHEQVDQIDRVEIERHRHVLQRLRRIEIAAGNLDAHGDKIVEEARPHAGGLEMARSRHCRAPVPVRTNLKISCIWMMSPSRPVISAIEVTLRLPSDRR